MSKIIIHNKSKFSDQNAVECVLSVVKSGFISGEKQYCWVSQFYHPIISGGVDVLSMKTRGETHTFKVVDNNG